MMVLTATGIVDELGLQTYAVNAVSRALLDPGWTNGLKHLYAFFLAAFYTTLTDTFPQFRPLRAGPPEASRLPRAQ